MNTFIFLTATKTTFLFILLLSVIGLFMACFAYTYNITEASVVQTTNAELWNNDNILTRLHPKVSSFNVTKNGFEVEMEDNTQIKYTWLIRNKLLRGDWQEAYFHVCKSNFFYGHQLEELSECLATI